MSAVKLLSNDRGPDSTFKDSVWFMYLFIFMIDEFY